VVCDVARIHGKIEEIGFDKFSKATEEMKARHRSL